MCSIVSLQFRKSSIYQLSIANRIIIIIINGNTM
jgi:hypothetical protein